MNLKNRLILVVGVLGLISFFSNVQGQSIGKRVGPQFPFLAGSARLAGLADASSGVTDEFSGFGSNPSTLGMLKKSIADYATQRVQKGITFEHLGLTYKASSVEAISFSFEVLHFGGTDFYTNEDVRKLGYEARTGLAYGRLLAEGFSAGINLQALTSTTGPNSVWAFAGDVGFMYVPGKYIRYALVLKGLGNDYRVPIAILKTDLQSIRLAKVLSLGLVFDFPFDDQRKKLVVALQNDKILGEQSLLYRLGAEYYPSYSEQFRLAFRGGMIVRGIDIEPRFGLGIGYSQLNFDYSYGYIKRDNQPTQMFTISFYWPSNL